MPSIRKPSIRKRLRPASLQNWPGGGAAGVAPVLESPIVIQLEKRVALSLVLEAIGHKGGIWFLSSMQGTCYKLVYTCDQCVTIEVRLEYVLWRCSGIYGSPKLNTRSLFWDYLVAQSSSFQGPWIILGDFNEVLFSHEAKGCHFFSTRADQFAKSLGDSALFDLKTIGRRFFGTGGVKNNIEVAKRLDWWYDFRRVPGKLSEVQKNSFEFNSTVFGNIFVRKYELEHQINYLRKRLEEREDCFMHQKEQQLIEDYNNTLVLEELLWFQKSRE
ncbi:uncharacterized protein [Arachis hypogaea]|uniref:uncharacterized protein n=1 Tax=Arachis hypogaea TaxID=3818 RepID=UPI000DECACA0